MRARVLAEEGQIVMGGAGADSFLQLIQAERDRADARAARAASDAAVADAQISLFKALGGGWEGQKP